MTLAVGRARPTTHVAAPAASSRPREDAPETLGVLLIADPPLLRAGLRAILSRASDLTAVGEGRDAADAAPLAARLRPHVVVLRLPEAAPAPVGALGRIAAGAPEARVLLLAPSPDVASLLAAVRAGARGCVAEGAGEADLLRAIRAVGHGDVTFGAKVADGVLDRLANAEVGSARAFPGLTAREEEVLELLAEGAGPGQIALRLGLSAKTIRNHVSSLCTKLGALDRTQAALRAREAGYGGGVVLAPPHPSGCAGPTRSPLAPRSSSTSLDRPVTL